MLKTLKKLILVDKTQPLEQIKKQYKARVYYFLGLSWLMSFLLIWIIPQDIMRHDWAKGFVDFMGVIVPMVDGLEQIRLYGSSDPYKAHLTVLPHISFYYAVLWAYAWVSVPYMMVLVRGNFIFNNDSTSPFVATKNFIEFYKNKKLLYYFSSIFIIVLTLLIYIYSDASTNWFKIRYIYTFSVGIFSSLFTIGILFLLISFLYNHFLIKQQERTHAK